MAWTTGVANGLHFTPAARKRVAWASQALQGLIMQHQGLCGLIVPVADVCAIVNIFQSAADTGRKA